MTSQAQYRADLSDTALPEILFTIYRHRVPGIVEARRGDVVKKVFVRDGDVVYASSSDLSDSLGVHLRSTGRLSTEDFRKVMDQRRLSRKKLGEILVETDLLSPAEIYSTVREQVEAVVWSLFSWSDGTVSFEIGDFVPKGMIGISLPMQQVILQGVDRTPSDQAKALVARLGGKEVVFEPDFRLGDLIEAAVDREHMHLLRLVDGERTLVEICRRGEASTLQNAKRLYAFWVLGLVCRRGEKERSAKSPRSETRLKFKTGSDRLPKA